MYWAETQIGWLPYCLSQIDDNYERNRYWAERFWGLEPLPRPPSQYLKTQCHWGFMKDPLGVELRHRIGVDRIMWGSDFPHLEGCWPFSRDHLRLAFAGVPEDEVRMMVGRNAADVYGFDWELLERLADEHGPTPQEVAEPLAAEDIPDAALRCPASPSREARSRRGCGIDTGTIARIASGCVTAAVHARKPPQP